jgi:hypothetical protein
VASTLSLSDPEVELESEDCTKSILIALRSSSERVLKDAARQRNLDTSLFQHLTADIESAPFDTDNSSYIPSSLDINASREHSPLESESSLSQASSSDLFGLEVITNSSRKRGSLILDGKRPYCNALNPDTPIYQHNLANKVEY